MALKHTEQLDELFRSMLLLENVEECYRYFEDICTVKEVLALAQRLEVAEMLADGRSYQETIAATGSSSATISRVKRCLDYGADGYTLILKRLKETEKKA